MNRLSWPPWVDAAKKEESYTILGGNFRAIEWVNVLLLVKPGTWETLEQEFEHIKIPDDTEQREIAFVRQAMKQNLLFTHLLTLLSREARTLLARLSIYETPVTMTGVRIQTLSGTWEDSPLGN